MNYATWKKLDAACTSVRRLVDSIPKEADRSTPEGNIRTAAAIAGGYLSEAWLEAYQGWYRQFLETTEAKELKRKEFRSRELARLTRKYGKRRALKLFQTIYKTPQGDQHHV